MRILCSPVVVSHANSVVATLRTNCSGSELRATGGTAGAPDAEGLAVAGVVEEGDGPVGMVGEVPGVLVGVWGPVARP